MYVCDGAKATRNTTINKRTTHTQTKNTNKHGTRARTNRACDPNETKAQTQLSAMCVEGSCDCERAGMECFASCGAAFAVHMWWEIVSAQHTHTRCESGVCCWIFQ